jgi:hypothetical protein
MKLMEDIFEKAALAAANQMQLKTVIVSDDKYLSIESELRKQCLYMDRCVCPRCEFHRKMETEAKMKIILNTPYGHIEIKRASKIEVEFAFGWSD